MKPSGPLKRGKPLKRTGRLSQRSKTREEEAADRRIVVLEVLARDRNACRASALVPAVSCRGPLDVHEVIPRSAWAKGYLVAGNAVAVCRAHHDWIGEHPTEAATLGLHGYSWQRP